MRTTTPAAALVLVVLAATAFTGAGQVLDRQKMLDAQAFWDNRDWDWYTANVPFLETPDKGLDTTYYYRWELVTKHMVYGSPETGYAFTEFLDRPFWSGRYGAISCPAGHQLYELRWLKDRRYAQDYARYWFATDGAQPRRYSTWLADSVRAIAVAQGDDGFAVGLLDGLVKNYDGWEKTHFTPEVGLFWQTGHDEGMEYSITSRQTQDIMRGGPGYRPSMNAYMYADALAISAIAKRAGRDDIAGAYAAKAAKLKENVRKLLWDGDREFFFHVFKQDETSKEGHKVKALTKTHETGQFAGSLRGRELIGYVPWQFNLPDVGHESAWKFLMDADYFFAPFGPTTTERRDPMFRVMNHCCWWSGQSWPYATTQTLVAMANLLNNYDQDVVGKADYVKLLQTYSNTHRKDGKPYIAEGANPDTGSWEGYDSYNHSEHYFHSGFTDLVITGLAGLRPRADDTLEVNPLIPDDWAYFCLDDVGYRGRRVTILWDKDGTRYGKGAGLRVIVDGKELVASPALKKLTAPLPPAAPQEPTPRLINYAANNDGHPFPRPIASFTSDVSDLGKVNDGQYWYTIAAGNRWTAEGSGDAADWVGIDFGTKRPIHTVKLYVLDDGETVTAPREVGLEYHDGRSWRPIGNVKATLDRPTGRRANTYTFAKIDAEKIRAVLTHAAGAKSGLSEFEAWGAGELPVAPAPPRPGNLALNAGGAEFPRATASHTSRHDKAGEAIDGRIQFNPEPRNRWTAWESKEKSDWLEIDFGQPKTVARAELYVYDDRGGVQAPAGYTIQYLDGGQWKECERQTKVPKTPKGGQVNTATFTPVTTQKIRVVFTHKGSSRAGLTELELWAE